MISVNIKEKGYERHLELTFVNDMFGVPQTIGTLIRPTQAKYEINQKPSSGPFLSFIYNLQHNIQGVFSIYCDSVYTVRIQYDPDGLNPGLSIIHAIKTIDGATFQLNQGSNASMRRVWYAFTRQGFRPNVKEFY
jgi:hypothetical protein